MFCTGRTNLSRLKGFVCLLLGSAVLLNQATPAHADEYEIETALATRDYERSFSVQDPISAANGAYYFNMPLLSLGGPMDLRFELFYHSDYWRTGTLLTGGFWWRPFAHAVLGYPEEGNEYATVYLRNGNTVVFKKNPQGEWALGDPTITTGYGITYTDNVPRTKYALVETDGFAYLMDPVEERVDIFQKYLLNDDGSRAARIVRVLDRNGNHLSYSYPSNTSNKPSRIDDGLGRYLDLAYPPPTTMLGTVTDQGGRRVTLTYETNGADNANRLTLRSVTDAFSQTTTFRYAGWLYINNAITRQELPRGNVPYTQTYGVRVLDGNWNRRVITQTDALGNATTFDYSPTANVVTVRQPDGATRAFEHFSAHGYPKAITDTIGNTAQFAKSAQEQLTSLTDKMGDTTTLDYHADTGLLAGFTNALGDSISTAFGSRVQSFTNPISPTQIVTFTFYKPTRASLPDGTYEEFTYDEKGNLLARRDRGGGIWSYTYNSHGQVLTLTNPAGGVISSTYNADATLASRADSDTGVTTYAYDVFKRVSRMTNPDGSFVDLSYNNNDLITRSTDERGNTTILAYDANGNLTGLTDPAGNSTTYVHDDMDRLVAWTDRLGNTTTNGYDVLGRLQAVTDPTGLTIQYRYDPRGLMNGLTIAGRTWETAYDQEGLVTTRTTPLGHTTYERDKLGHISKLTNHLNQSVSFGRDSLARVTSRTDSLGRVTSFVYDQRGLLSQVSMPIVGTAVYTRTALGRLSQIRDLEGETWSFGYTLMGRQTSTTDPLGHISQDSYDNRGRLGSSILPDGTTLTNTYDYGGNLVRSLYSEGTDLQYSYDSLNRLTSANGIQISYDAEGRVVNTENPGVNFGATYDAAGRLKTASYANGTFTVTYSYRSDTGLLSEVADNLTGAQLQLSYDDAFRLTGITRTNGISTSLSWDEASRLVGIKEGSFLSLQYTLNGAGKVAQVQMAAPLDPAARLATAADSFTYDDASEVASSGYAYDERGRLIAAPGKTYRWNGASRLVGIGSTALGYNGLGDVVTRTEGLSGTHYYYNGAIGRRPVVAERDEAKSQFLRFYVWTPDGRLLYMVDAAGGNKVYYYHFDRTGSTLALTDQSGQITDSYAYDPYGRLLARQGASPQPFTFVGQYGVRQEDASGTLYQMRMRYYDAATARFLSRDPLWPLPGDVKQINPYQYAGGEPIGFVDFRGTQAVPSYIDKLPDYFTAEDLGRLSEAERQFLSDLGQQSSALTAEIWRLQTELEVGENHITDSRFGIDAEIYRWENAERMGTDRYTYNLEFLGTASPSEAIRALGEERAALDSRLSEIRERISELSEAYVRLDVDFWTRFAQTRPEDHTHIRTSESKLWESVSSQSK